MSLIRFADSSWRINCCGLQISDPSFISFALSPSLAIRSNSYTSNFQCICGLSQQLSCNLGLFPPCCIEIYHAMLSIAVMQRKCIVRSPIVAQATIIWPYSLLHMRDVDHSHVCVSILVVPLSSAGLGHAKQFLGYQTSCQLQIARIRISILRTSQYHLQVSNKQPQLQVSIVCQLNRVRDRRSQAEGLVKIHRRTMYPLLTLMIRPHAPVRQRRLYRS